MGDPKQELIDHKKALNDGITFLGSLLGADELPENADLDTEFHNRNNDFTVSCIMSIVSHFAEKEGYEKFARFNENYVNKYEGFDQHNAVHEYTYDGKDLDLTLSKDRTGGTNNLSDYWSGVNQAFLSDFVAFASQDEYLSADQRRILERAQRAVNINNVVILQVQQQMGNTATNAPPLTTNYASSSAIPANATGTFEEDTQENTPFVGEPPEQPELYDMPSADEMQQGIDQIQAILAEKQKIFEKRIKQLLVLTNEDIHPVDVVGDYELVKGNEPTGILGTVNRLHAQRLAEQTEIWGEEAKGYVVLGRDSTPYYVKRDGSIYEWDETSPADKPSFKLDNPVGKIINIDQDGSNGAKAHVATAALLLSASGLDPNNPENKHALTQYQREELADIERQERDILAQMGIDIDHYRHEIVQQLHNFPLYAEDVFGVDANKEILTDKAREIIKNVTGQSIEGMDDLMFLLIAKETTYRDQSFHPDYTGMYHDPKYRDDVSLALMSDIVIGAATGDTPDILDEIGVKPDMSIVHDNFFPQAFHEIVDNNGGYIPDQVKGELLGTGLEDYLGEGYADKQISREKIMQITRQMILDEAHGRGITNITEAMIKGEYNPPIEYLKWAYKATALDPDELDAGPKFYQWNKSWNEDFGSLASLEGKTFNTMVGGRILENVTVKDIAAHKFMRIMPAVHPDRFPELMKARNSGNFMTYEEIKKTLEDSGNTYGLEILESEVQNSLHNQSYMTFAIYSNGTRYHDSRSDYNKMRNEFYLPHEEKITATREKRAEFVNEVGELTGQNVQPYGYEPRLPTLESRVTMSADAKHITDVTPPSTTTTPPSTTSTPPSAPAVPAITTPKTDPADTPPASGVKTTTPPKRTTLPPPW